jgi:hypothetical protein
LNTAVPQFSDAVEENPESFELQLRFVAFDVTNGKEQFDEFTVVIESSMETKDELCMQDFANLSITDAMTGDRYYQITEDEHWQEYYVESVVAGFENFNLPECEKKLALAIDY